MRIIVALLAHLVAVGIPATRGARGEPPFPTDAAVGIFTLLSLAGLALMALEAIEARERERDPR